MKDAEKPIYPGCNKFTKLSVLLRLYNIKAKHGLSDTSITDTLSFMVELLPENNEMPLSFYEAKKTLRVLGMQYEKKIMLVLMIMSCIEKNLVMQMNVRLVVNQDG